MAATQPMPMPPITPSGGGGAGNWFSTHKGLAIGGGIVGLLALYYLYTKMKSSSSSSSSGANVGSGSGTVDILTGPTGSASQSGTQSGMGEQAYYAQLQALQSGIDTQLQNQIASSGTGTSSYGSTGTGNGSSTGTSTGTSTSQPVVSTSTPTWSSQPMQTTTPVASQYTYLTPAADKTLPVGTALYGMNNLGQYVQVGTKGVPGEFNNGTRRLAEGISTNLYTLN